METSISLNLALFNLINATGTANPTVVLIAKGLAVYSPWAVIAILLWCWLRKTPEARHGLMIAGVALVIGLAANLVLASLFYQPRPFVIGVGHTLLSHSRDSSFPSDHATFLWALGFGLLLTYPLRRLGVVIAGLGLAVAWARVYLGVHFPLDMAGSLMIALCATVCSKALAGRLNGVFFQPVERLNSRILRSIPGRASGPTGD